MTQQVRKAEDFGDGLTRLGDSRVDWNPDHSQMMSSLDWYGADVWGPTYGNFWSKRPCWLRAHQWANLGRPESEVRPDVPRQYQRSVWRCQRCGSQVFQAPMYGPTPHRGRL